MARLLAVAILLWCGNAVAANLICNGRAVTVPTDKAGSYLAQGCTSETDEEALERDVAEHRSDGPIRAMAIGGGVALAIGVVVILILRRRTKRRLGMLRVSIVLMLVGCGGSPAAPDALVDVGGDAGPTWYTDAFHLATCDANWASVANGPAPGVMCEAACADFSTIGRGGPPCAKARHETVDGQVMDVFQCTVGTSTTWKGWKGCCLIQPDFAYIRTNPVTFAICDDDFR